MPVKTKKLSVLIVDDPRLNKREDSGMPDGNVGILAPHGAGNNVTQFFSALPLHSRTFPLLHEHTAETQRTQRERREKISVFVAFELGG